MSSYPPTPAFGVFNFVPPKAPLAPVRPQQQQQGGASTHVSVLQADSTSRRPTLPPQRSQTGPSSASPSRASLSPAKMESHSSDALSDSPEEGELSESHSANRDNGSSNSPNISSDDEGRPPCSPLFPSWLGCSLFRDMLYRTSRYSRSSTPRSPEQLVFLALFGTICTPRSIAAVSLSSCTDRTLCGIQAPPAPRIASSGSVRERCPPCEK